VSADTATVKLTGDGVAFYVDGKLVETVTRPTDDDTPLTHESGVIAQSDQPVGLLAPLLWNLST
jgi:hypothetical protein